jgi:ribosome-associated toxin RatA of RatAB toxin-antitoxin module
MHLVFSLLAFILLGFTVTAANATQKEAQWSSDWEQRDGKEGIRAQCRQHKNNIEQCKFTVVVNESVSALSAVITDVANYKTWVDSILISELLSSPDLVNEILVYVTYNFIGAYDRDAVLLYTPKQDPETKAVKIIFKTVDKEIPKTDLRLVRFPLLAGYWQFKPLNNGTTEIEHMSFAPPGGVVQKTLYYVYNMSYFNATFDTIHALLNEAQKDKYQTAKNAFMSQ